jgi:hypothetical protein
LPNINVNIGAAVGISDDFLLEQNMLKQAGASFLCIDVAHGHPYFNERGNECST